MIDIAWNMSQKRCVDGVGQAADNASHKSEVSVDKVLELETRIDRLTLLTQAMWEVLCENVESNKFYLLAKVQEIDRRDGIEVSTTLEDSDWTSNTSLYEEATTAVDGTDNTERITLKAAGDYVDEGKVFFRVRGAAGE